MAKAEFQIIGLAELTRRLKKAAETDILDAIKAANLDAANLVKDAAAPNAPVRTGALLASLRASATAKQGVVRIGKSSVPYAGPIIFGWRKHHITANPFIYKAADSRRQQITDAYQAQIEKVLRMIANG